MVLTVRMFTKLRAKRGFVVFDGLRRVKVSQARDAVSGAVDQAFNRVLAPPSWMKTRPEGGIEVLGVLVDQSSGLNFAQIQHYFWLFFDTLARDKPGATIVDAKFDLKVSGPLLWDLRRAFHPKKDGAREFLHLPAVFTRDLPKKENRKVPITVEKNLISDFGVGGFGYKEGGKYRFRRIPAPK